MHTHTHTHTDERWISVFYVQQNLARVHVVVCCSVCVVVCCSVLQCVAVSTFFSATLCMAHIVTFEHLSCVISFGIYHICAHVLSMLLYASHVTTREHLLSMISLQCAAVCCSALQCAAVWTLDITTCGHPMSLHMGTCCPHLIVGCGWAWRQTTRGS